MAVVNLTEVEVAVREAVGTSALLYGRALSRAGKVVSISSDTAGMIAGLVVDGAREQSVQVLSRRRPDGGLDAGSARCDCGAVMPCRHVAALFLAGFEPTARGRKSSTSSPPNARVPRIVPSWELSLQAALADPQTAPGAGRPGQGHGCAPDVPPVALQFEVSGPTGAGPGPAVGRDPSGGGAAAGARLAIRLVVPGRSGGWIRSGVSWTSLAYPDYYLRRVPADQVRLLREIYALPTKHDHGYRDKVLWLDDVVSRRTWDLLLEVRECGLPLVTAGKDAGPVRVHPGSVTTELIIRRDGDEVVIDPVVQIDNRIIGEHVPIGSPPHGIAWFRAGRAGGLHLARLGAAPPALFARLATTGQVRIPATEQDRFLATYFPQLARHVQVSCPDDSVPLPPARPPVLEVTATTLGDHRVGLDWAWIYRRGEDERREPLALPTGPAPPHRDPAAEARVLAEVLPRIESVPGVVHEEAGEILPIDHLEIDGIDTARLMTQVVPLLRACPDVEVRIDPQAGPIPDYRRVDAPAVIEFAPTSAAGVGEGTNGEQDWFDLAVTVSLDGHLVPFDQLFVALAQRQSHLLLDDGVWFALDRPEFADLARVIAESRDLMDAPPGTVRLGRFHAGLWEEIESLGVITGQVQVWRDRIAVLLEGYGRTDVSLPSTLHADLRPYQEDGFRRLVTMFAHGLGGILADDMGLGKTLQTLALVAHAREHAAGADRRPFLVVAPTSVVGNWAEQAARFAPDLSVVAITQTTARRGAGVADLCTGVDLVVTSYTLFRLEHEQYGAVAWAGLILDEAQNVKNYHSAAYRCARELPAAFKLAITGTPMENNLMELWSLLSITAPGLFPRPEKFTDYYRTPIERNGDADRLAQLRRRIRPLVLRRTKEQVAADLPERVEQVVELPLQPKHRAVYQKYLQRERQKVLGLLGDFQRNRFEIFRSLTLLRQASLDAALVDPAHDAVPSTKVDALLEYLDGIVAEGHRVLVFSQFTRFLGRVAGRLDDAGLDYCYLDGRTRRRAEVIERFRAGTAPVFLISLKAGGTGLNLTEADYVIVLDPWWNPAVEAQAVDRVHRIGQTRNVMVYRFVAKDTIEEKVMALKERKAALTSSVLDGDDLASAALTADDIRGLLV